MVNLYKHQLDAIEQLESGSILCGGVGSGKSLTSLAHYHVNECGGAILINGFGEFKPMINPKPLYIITTARKRDSKEWEQECSKFALSTNQEISYKNTLVIIDSWNNIKKYKNVKDAFFIFDEQRLVGSGTWVKAFLEITKRNRWILLTATPGDVWIDYIPVFVANKFYKNRTEFLRRHVVYNNFSKYPKIDHYVETDRLERLRKQITVFMSFERKTNPIHKDLIVEYDKEKFQKVMIDRWNVFDNKPVKNVGELFLLMRKVVNSDPSRLEAIEELLKKHKKIIVFYNFNYELDILRTLEARHNVSEWNGQKHEDIPFLDTWVYLVQYTAGAEGWNCIDTNVVVYYSLNYSHKVVHQAGGRIDRINTPFVDLYYYHLRSRSPIDLAIQKSINNKQNFHESNFIKD